MTDTAAPWATAAQRLGERAWGWLDAGREQFALAPDVTADQLDRIRQLKPLGELALVGSIAVREGATGSRAAWIAPALVEFVWRQLRAGDLLYELQCDRPLDTFPIECYAVFVRAGYRHTRLDTALAHLRGLRANQVPALVPNQVVGVVKAEQLVGLPAHGDLDALVARTWLGVMPEPWATDLDTLYGMTHTVFHLTDWGARPGGLAPQLQSYLHAWLPAWLEVYIEAGHWDVVGEMLSVDLCLSKPDYPVSAWESLADAQQPDGMIPADPGRDSHTAATAVRNHYHSTVVAALAATLAIARRLDPHRP